MFKLNAILLTAIILFGYNALAQETNKKRMPIGTSAELSDAELECFKSLVNARQGQTPNPHLRRMIVEESAKMLGTLQETNDGLISSSMKAVNSCTEAGGLMGQAARISSDRLYPARNLKSQTNKGSNAVRD